MKKFEQVSARTFEEAAAILGTNPNAKAYAGGTDVIGAQKSNIYAEYPELLVSLKHIEGADAVHVCEDALYIGAFATLDAIAKHPTIKNRLPMLAEAARDVASPQIRHVATVAGNICQEPRCWYYRYPNNGFPCLRKGGKFCSAVGGNDLYHSIFGGAKACASACETRCPNHTPIPAYAEMLRNGDMDGAAALLWRTHPLAPVTGRVCPHNCESDCARGEFLSSVSIRCMERAVGDRMIEAYETLMPKPDPSTGKHVAIVGAGPAGLTAAYYLALMGHAVTVFDENEHIGGMLYYGIPTYRLQKQVLAEIKKIWESIGISFRMQTVVGKDVKLKEIASAYDAVLSAPGAQFSRRAGVPNEEYAVGGVDFLHAAALQKASVPGKRIVVVGGGSVAMDVAVTAKRLGAEQVTAVCLEPAGRMPAAAEELQDAIDEGIVIENGFGPMSVVVENGIVTGLQIKACPSVWDEKGRFSPVYDESVTKILPCDGVYMAIGQRAELSFMDGIENAICMGDAATGPKTVVEAIANAKLAVEQLTERIGGAMPETNIQDGALSFDRNCVVESQRLAAKKNAVSARTLYGSDTVSPTTSEAIEEAKRCYNCSCLAVTPTDLGTALTSLDALVVTTKRTLPIGKLFVAGMQRSTVLEHDELVKVIIVPLPKENAVQSYQKYRARKSVDFPLVSLASMFELEDGKFVGARMTFGAAAPTPMRLTAIEALLIGKEPSDALSREAAEIVKKSAKPLSNNAYKVRIAAALVRRAIAGCIKN